MIVPLLFSETTLLVLGLVFVVGLAFIVIGTVGIIGFLVAALESLAAGAASLTGRLTRYLLGRGEPEPDDSCEGDLEPLLYTDKGFPSGEGRAA